MVVRENPAARVGRGRLSNGKPLSPHGHREKHRWRHPNIFLDRCEIVRALPRRRGRSCGPTVPPEPPRAGKSKGFILRFTSMCFLLLRYLPVAPIARLVEEHDIGVSSRPENARTGPEARHSPAMSRPSARILSTQASSRMRRTGMDSSS